MSGICKANQRQQSRRKPQYTRYENEGRREKNKVKRLVRHLKKFDDSQAMTALKGMVADNSMRRKMIPVQIRWW